MSFSSVINLGTVSTTITSVKLSACTNSSCTGGSVITGYENVNVSGFTPTKIVTGIPDGTTHIKVEALGTCSGTSQCLSISGLPTATPTPTPTATPTVTPTPTATSLAYTSFTIYVDTSNNGLGWSSGESACAGTGTMRTVYVDGNGYSSLYNAVVDNGKSLHTSSIINESTLFNGEGLWYKTVSEPNEGGNFTVSTVGEVPTFNQLGCSVTPSYAISVNPTSSSDGGGAYTATVTAANVSFPQTLYITILSTVGTVNSSDFQSNFPSTITLTYSGEEYSFSLAEDHLTEGTEKFKLELRSGSSSGTVLYTSSEITILDTSLDTYYYTLTPCAGGSNLYSTGYQQGTYSSGNIVEGSSGTYYVIAGSTTTDPGGNKISVTLATITSCPEVTPPPTPELTMNNLTSDCTNVGTYKGKVYASWSDGNPPYQVKAGFVGSGLSSTITTNNTSITISDPSSPYDGGTGIRNTTGGSDVFVVEVTDNATITKSKSISINCTYTDTTPNWVYKYQTCDGCVTYNVERDDNVNSATSGHYRYNGIDRYPSVPTNGACVTTQVQGSQIGTVYSCVSDQISGQGEVYSVPVYENSNGCYSGPERFLWNGTWVSSDPSNNESDVTGANWQVLSSNCVSGKIVNTVKDFGPCSPTWGQTTTVTTTEDCVNYSSFGYFANTCNDAVLGLNLYLVVKNEQLNNYRYNDEYGELVSGTIYNEDTGSGSRAHNFAVDGTLSGISQSTCD